MASWTEILITVATKDSEKAIAIISVVAQNGIQIEDYSDMEAMLPLIGHYDYVSDELLSKDRSKVNIKLFCDPGTDLSDVVSFLKERFLHESVEYELTLNTVEETDWQENWKQYYHPQKIGSSIVICPSWEEYLPTKNETVIVLDPGMSFGTGDHETTQLCLMFLEELNLSGRSLLDVGTGSGILAIAALKLNAASVTAVDIDPVAVLVSHENAKINNVLKSFRVFGCSIDNIRDIAEIPDRFDFITANVVADFHIARSGLYFDKLIPGGELIVSGIISSMMEQVNISLENAGFTIIKENTLNGWGAFHARKP